MSDSILDEFDPGCRDVPSGMGQCQGVSRGKRCTVLNVAHRHGGKRYCNYHYKKIVTKHGVQE